MLNIRLVLFFTCHVSLQTWVQNGSLERELALYWRLQNEGIHVSFVTYGDARDLGYAKDLNGIEILCNKWNLPLGWYERLLPFLYPLHFLKSGVIKTNQTNGAEIALRVAKIWRKPLIARCGYMWSDLKRSNGRNHEANRARMIENRVFLQAQRVVVTTESMREYVIKEYNVAKERVHIIPNYVLTDVFSPEESQPLPNRVCFVGRLSEEKNLFSLVEACTGLDVDLHFVGEGHLRTPLQEKARELGVRLTLHGVVSHLQLPSTIRQSALFTLVSTHEGHPKALLEAMSCGLPVVGTDVPGIREIIQHGENGWLCGIEAREIRQAIQTVLGNPVLQKRLGENAQQTIKRKFSLDHVVELELDLLEEIIK